MVASRRDSEPDDHRERVWNDEGQYEHVLEKPPRAWCRDRLVDSEEDCRGAGMTLDGSEELRLLAEIARWTREAALPVVRERVERLVDSDSKKRVYEAIAEGGANMTAIEKSTGVNHTEARKWIDEWEAEGIAVPD